MRAVVVNEPGGPEVLSVAEVADPVAGAGEVLLEVTAAGVNRADLLQRQGFYPPPADASPYLGLECSGVVARDHGPWAAGDPVCALLSGGGYAERVAVPVGQVMPVPAGIDMIGAACLPEVACTVYSNLAMVASLTSGETLLVHGGGSGIGTFAVQWATAIGARVLVTVGSEEKGARCRALGAVAAVNYRTQDFEREVRDLTDGRGADVILDIVGAQYLQRNVRTLALGGRLVVIGLQGGVSADLDIGRLLARRGTIHATSLRARPDSEKADICGRVVADVWPLVAAGAIRPVVDRVFRLSEATAAHRALSDGASFGKAALDVAAG
jgi:putative PIG3 family NAD(P)H quinone oxidoreductase